VRRITIFQHNKREKRAHGWVFFRHRTFSQNHHIQNYQYAYSKCQKEGYPGSYG
jgi:hypothetical protein